MFLSGCAETIALLGPASSLIGGGNVVHSTISSAASYGVKKTTGKSPMQHVLTYAEEKNPDKNKDRCLSFAKETESEACYIVKKEMGNVFSFVVIDELLWHYKNIRKSAKANCDMSIFLLQIWQ